MTHHRTRGLVIESGGNDDAVIDIQSMAIVRVECSGGTGYTGSDISRLHLVNSLSETSSPSQLIAGLEYYTLSHAEIYSSSITNEGDGYAGDASVGWNGVAFVTIANGVPVAAAQPALTHKKRLKSVQITGSGIHTTAPSLTLTSSPPVTGSSPTLKTIAGLESITTTSRGSGYSKSSAVTSSGFYYDIGLTNPGGDSILVSELYVSGCTITNPGLGYEGGEDVILNGATVGSVSQVEIRQINVLNGGMLYTSAPSVSFSGGNGSPGGAATAQIGAITAALSSFPLLSQDEVDLGSPSGGDTRKIAYAMADSFYQMFSGNIFQHATASRQLGRLLPNFEREITYTFDFSVERSVDYDLKDE